MYYSKTFANEILNAHVAYLEHKMHCLQREYLEKILNMETPDITEEEKKKLLQMHDFITQKIQYDYIMAIKARNELSALVQTKESK